MNARARERIFLTRRARPRLLDARQAVYELKFSAVQSASSGVRDVHPLFGAKIRAILTETGGSDLVTTARTRTRIRSGLSVHNYRESRGKSASDRKLFRRSARSSFFGRLNIALFCFLLSFRSCSVLFEICRLLSRSFLRSCYPSGKKRSRYDV